MESKDIAAAHLAFEALAGRAVNASEPKQSTTPFSEPENSLHELAYHEFRDGIHHAQTGQIFLLVDPDTGLRCLVVYATNKYRELVVSYFSETNTTGLYLRVHVDVPIVGDSWYDFNWKPGPANADELLAHILDIPSMPGK